jgi:hypothetical protein
MCMFIGCTQLNVQWKTWRVTFETWISHKVILRRGTFFMRPLVYVLNTCKGLEQLIGVFGMPMKRRGCLERFNRVHPSHAHFMCNCVIWHMPMCVKTMKLCLHGKNKSRIMLMHICNSFCLWSIFVPHVVNPSTLLARSIKTPLPMSCVYKLYIC